MKRNAFPELKRISTYHYENIFDVIKDEDGNYFYNLYNTIHLGEVNAGLYKIHNFSEGDIWTKLANKYYGEPNLWWIIVVANNIQNPLDLPEPGTKLKILNKDVVSRILSQIITNGNES